MVPFIDPQTGLRLELRESGGDELPQSACLLERTVPNCRNHKRRAWCDAYTHRAL